MSCTADWIDQRTHQRVAIQRISDRDGRVGRDEPLAHFLRNRFVDDDAARGGATLSRRADRAEENRARRHFQDPRCGVTMTALLPPSSRMVRPSRRWTACADLNAHRAGAGRGNQRDTSVCGQCVAQRVATSPMSRVNMAGSAPVSRQTRLGDAGHGDGSRAEFCWMVSKPWHRRKPQPARCSRTRPPREN